MLIYEFNGLPGTGKTTLSDYLFERLKEKYKVGTRIDLHTDLYKNRNLRIKIAAILAPNLIKYNLLILKYSAQYGLTRERLKWAGRLILLHYLINSALKKKLYDILLIDEGIVQHLTSIPHSKIIKNNKVQHKLFELFSQKYQNSIIINCNINRNINAHRLKKRNRLGSRFDMEKVESLIPLLEVKEMNLHIVREYLKSNKSIEIDMESNLSDNADEILKVNRLFGINHG